MTRRKHGFIASQREGIEVFRGIDPDAPLIVAEAVWQYSHHVLAGLTTHRGPILTVANWSGQWPGLVGLLNLNASLTKAGVTYSTLWSETFTDSFFTTGLNEWLTTGKVTHDQSHVRDLPLLKLPAEDEKLGSDFGRRFRHHKAISVCSMKAAWACSTRSFLTSCCTPPAASRSVSASPRSTR
jgi:hypothetical protein